MGKEAGFFQQRQERMKPNRIRQHENMALLGRYGSVERFKGKTYMEGSVRLPKEKLAPDQTVNVFSFGKNRGE